MDYNSAPASRLLFNNGNASFTSSGDIDADNNALAAFRQAQNYDPNASIDAGGMIQMDRSKLPKFIGPDPNASYGKQGSNDINFSNLFSPIIAGKGVGGAEVKDPSKIIHDPNYGDWVAKSDLNPSPGDSTSGFMGQLEKYMPMVVSSIMAAGIGAGAGPALGGLIQGGMKAGDSLANGGGLNYQQLLGSLAGMTGIPGAGGLINFIMQQMQKQKSGGG